MYDGEFREKQLLIAFHRFIKKKESIRPGYTNEQKEAEQLEQQFIQLLKKATKGPYGFDLLTRLRKYPLPRLWGYIIEELADSKEVDAEKYLKALAETKVLLTDMRDDKPHGAPTLNAIASKAVAARGILPVAEMERQYNFQYFRDIAAQFPPDQWIPLFIKRLEDLKDKDPAFLREKGTSKERFSFQMGFLILMFAPQLEDQAITRLAMESMLLSGGTSVWANALNKHMPGELFTENPGKYVTSMINGKQQVHPIASGLKRFKDWDERFILKCLKAYMADVNYKGNSYHNQQQDLDLLHELVVEHGTMNTVLKLVPLLTTSSGSRGKGELYKPSEREWKQFIARIIQEIGDKLSTEDSEIKESLDELLGRYDEWFTKK